jgi:hypothetical protein
MLNAIKSGFLSVVGFIVSILTPASVWAGRKLAKLESPFAREVVHATWFVALVVFLVGGKYAAGLQGLGLWSLAWECPVFFVSGCFRSLVRDQTEKALVHERITLVPGETTNG